MKVTVCFGNIRVVVPCGKDNLTVADLQKQACARYRKIIGKSSDYWVRVLQLGSAVDGGILDWDDLVQDVVEDKEKLIAVFEEDDPQHADWDLGSVVSSEDRNTPRRTAVKHPYELPNGGSRQRYLDHGSLGSSFYSRDSSLEVDVGIETLKSNTQIVVRRESDPSVNAAAVHNHKSSLNSMSQTEQSGYNGSDVGESRRPSRYTRRSRESNSVQREEPNNNNSKTSDNDTRIYFKRDKFRQSMASGLSESLESEEPVYNRRERDYYYDSSYQSDLSANLADSIKQLNFAERLNLPWYYRESQELVLVNDGTPLGFQVGSYFDSKSSKFIGLVVESITPGSRVDIEDLLQAGDVIVEINHRVLLDLSPDVAHAILKESLYYPELQFRILPIEERERHITTPSRKKQSTAAPTLTLTMPSPQGLSGSNSALSASQLSASASSMSTHESPASSPLSKVPLIAQQSYDNVSLYTRKIGNQITICLKKEAQGLGFSITARDTTTVGDPGPIYIKNILPKGAAIVDGRLRAGDRLLKVNDQELSGLSQEEVVKILRSITSGSIVTLTVSRQSETLPRKLQDDPVTDKIISEDNLREYFMFEIALNDTGSAGLGISLKGNQSKKTGQDLGIFVKSVFHGGAAWQDGRLKANDQLIQVNGRSLTGVTNREAIDILRGSMSTEGNVRGMIQMVIARRKVSQDGLSSRVSSEASSDLSDSILDQFQNLTRTASEITETDASAANRSRVEQQSVHRHNEGTLSSVSSTDHSSGKGRPTSPDNPDVVVSEDDWPMSPGYDPFNRESAVRQSISEKRRDAVNRFFPNGDGPKSQKNKHNADMGKKESESGRKTPSHIRNLSSPVPLNKSKYNSTKNSNNSSSAGRNVDVGPTLGIAKSSSLESLQTAVETCYASENSKENPYPRPLPRVVRGRVLNDSFRAALDRSYDMPGDNVKQMETVHEEGAQRTSTASSSDDSILKQNKKRQQAKGTKLFGLFKINKTKRSPDPTYAKSRISENELHKQHLEARREKDFQRMQEENERIQAKARELRNKQAEEQKRVNTNHERPRPPSVPVTAMQRIKHDDPITWYKESASGRHSVDPTAMQSHRYPQGGASRRREPTSPDPRYSGGRQHEQIPSPPPRTVKHLKKDEHRRFTENVNTYSSLPRSDMLMVGNVGVVCPYRQPRRGSRSTDDESQQNTSRKAASPDESTLNSSLRHAGPTGRVMKQTSASRFDNLEFYNRQKPSSVRKASPPRAPKVPADGRAVKKSPSNVETPSPDRENRGRTLFYDDTMERTEPKRYGAMGQHGYHRREKSPEPPPQSFYVIQTDSKDGNAGRNSAAPAVVVRRSAVSPGGARGPRWVPPVTHRHSVYTDSPSKFYSAAAPPRVRSPSFQNAHARVKELSPSGRRWNDDLDDRGSASPSSSEIASRNREAYRKLMQPMANEGGSETYGKIEISAPYNL